MKPSKPSTRRSSQKTKLHKPRQSHSLKHEVFLPVSIKSIIDNVKDLSFSKLKELEFSSQTSFTNNIETMKSAVEAQKLSIQNLTIQYHIKLANPTQADCKHESKYQKSSQKSQSRRRDSEDFLADSKQLQFFNPFHFEEKGDQDFFHNL